MHAYAAAIQQGRHGEEGRGDWVRWIIMIWWCHSLLFFACVTAPTKSANTERPQLNMNVPHNQPVCDTTEVDSDQTDDETRTFTHVLSRTDNLVGWALLAPAPASSSTAATSAG